jgi:antitoxin component YwqK of YwqJK toxin-antitoxin module
VLVFAPAIGRADPQDCKKRGGTWREDGGLEGCMFGKLRDGVWDQRSGTGQLIQRDSYVRGDRAGVSTRFYGNCQIGERIEWAADMRQGAFASWLPTGAKDTEGSYHEDKRDGLWRQYLDGVKVQEGPYVDDLPDGDFTEWFTTGVKWRTIRIEDEHYTGPDPEACYAAEGQWEVDYKNREEGCHNADDVPDGVLKGYTTDGKLAFRTTYVDGVESGEHVDFHPTGEILRKGMYVAGAPDGVHEFRSRVGQLYGASTVTNGTGAWKAWFPDGTVAEAGEYVDGKQHGMWTTYHPKGHPVDETGYDHGMMDGPHREYYPTGEIMVDGAHAAGARTGVWTVFYSNGKVAWAGAYVDSVRVGFWYNGTYTGNPEEIGPMIDDRREGMWLLFNSDGSIKGFGPYVGGAKNGAWVEFWPSGEQWRVVTYIDDFEDNPEAGTCDRMGGAWVPDPQQRALGCQVCKSAADDEDSPILQLKYGVWRWWHPNGQLEKQGQLVADQRTGPWSFWYDNGQEMLAGSFVADREVGRWTGFYRDGRDKFDGGYVEGAPDGAWTTFHADGSTAAAGSYAGGQKTGAWTYFHPGGAKKEEGTYEAGVPTGAWTSYHPNGAKESAGAYAGGKRDGTWTWWRADGSVWRTATFVGGKEATSGAPRPGSARGSGS